MSPPQGLTELGGPRWFQVGEPQIGLSLPPPPQFPQHGVGEHTPPLANTSHPWVSVVTTGDERQYVRMALSYPVCPSPYWCKGGSGMGRESGGAPRCCRSPALSVPTDRPGTSGTPSPLHQRGCAWGEHTPGPARGPRQRHRRLPAPAEDRLPPNGPGKHRGGGRGAAAGTHSCPQPSATLFSHRACSLRPTWRPTAS